MHAYRHFCCQDGNTRLGLRIQRELRLQVQQPGRCLAPDLGQLGRVCHAQADGRARVADEVAHGVVAEAGAVLAGEQTAATAPHRMPLG